MGDKQGSVISLLPCSDDFPQFSSWARLPILVLVPYLTRAAGLALDTLAAFGSPAKQRPEMLGIPLPDWPITGNQFLSPAPDFQLGHASCGFPKSRQFVGLVFSETFFVRTPRDVRIGSLTGRGKKIIS